MPCARILALLKHVPARERDNTQWILELSSTGIAQERALADLRVILLCGLRAALRGWTRTRGREFDALADDFVQESLVQILDKLGTFKDLSRFTTWAHKICIRIALTELRRKRWKDSSLENMVENGRMMEDGRSAGPEAAVHVEMGMRTLMKIMAEELSEKQLAALNAVAMKGMPLEEAARRLGTNRNALYKTIHDARIKLKARMRRDGMTIDDLSN